MRIGMILDAPFPPDYRVEKEALTLMEQGHEVFLFCVDYRKGFHEEVYKGIHLVHYSSNTLTYKLSALAYTLPFYRWIMATKIKHFLKYYQPQVIHVHDMVIAEAAMSVAKSLGIKTVLDLHENRPASMREYRHLNKFPGSILINLATWEKKQRELVNNADRVVVVTSLAKDDLLRETKKQADKIIVIPNTSTFSFSKEPLNENILERMKDTFNVLYVGDTSLRRGTDDAIRAVALLKEKIPNIRLWIIGTSSADAELRALAGSVKVEQYVNFEGWQPQSLFISYISGAHLCLSPLKRNPHHDTTFANKIFQYMSLQRPVVASDCTAQAKLVEEENCGLVYPAANVGELSECIFKLYKDESWRARLGVNGKKAVEDRWNWERTSQPLISMYREIGVSL